MKVIVCVSGFLNFGVIGTCVDIYHAMRQKVYRTPGLLKMCHYDFKIRCHWLQLIYCQLFYTVTVKLKKVVTEISSSFYIILFDLSENYYCKIMGSIFIWSVYGKENLIQFTFLLCLSIIYNGN